MAEAVNPWEQNWGTSTPSASTETAPWEQNWGAPTEGNKDTPKTREVREAFTQQDIPARIQNFLLKASPGDTYNDREYGPITYTGGLKTQNVESGDKKYQKVSGAQIIAPGLDQRDAAEAAAAENEDKVKALTTSAALSFMPAVGGAAGAGAVGRLLQIGANAGRAEKVLKGAGIVGGAIGGGMATHAIQNAGLEAIAPQVMEDVNRSQAQNPTTSLVGGLAGMSPVMSIGGGANLLNRGIGAGLGAGMQAYGEIRNGSLDEDGLVRTALAGLGGAAFAHPTELGQAASNLGAKVANPITSRLGSVKGGDPIPKITQNTNEIALSTPEPPPTLPPPGMKGVMGIEKAQSSLPGLEAGAPKPTQEKINTKVTIPDPETGSPLTVDIGGPLGDFEPTEPFVPKKLSDTEVFNRRVKGVIDNLAAEGVEIDRQTAVKLARTTDRKEFNAARQTLIDSIKPPEVPKEGPISKAETKSLEEQGLKKDTIETGFQPIEPKPTMDFGPDKTPEQQALEHAAFNKAVTEIQKNLEAEGVSIDRQTSVKIANLRDPSERAMAIAKLIDSANPALSRENLEATLEAGKVVKPAEKDDFSRYQEISSEWESVVNKAKSDPTPENTQNAISMIGKFGKELETIKNRHGGMPPEKSSSAMGIVPEKDLSLKLAETGYDKTNDFLRNQMAKADVEATNPNAKIGSVFDPFVGHVKDDVMPDFEKPGVGRTQSKAERSMIEGRGYETEGLKPAYDSITGKPDAENQKYNAKVLYERMKADTQKNGTADLTPDTVGEISKVPERYKPFFTDLKSRLPLLDSNAGGRWISDKIGTMAKAVKFGLGLSETNIGDVLPSARGLVYQRDKYIGDLTYKFRQETEAFGRLSRETMLRDQFKELELATLTGDRELIIDIIRKNSSNPDELVAAFEQNMMAKEAARNLLIEAGRDVGEVDAYFARIVNDKAGLRAALGHDDGIYNDAIKAAREAKGRALTDAEEAKVLNDLILGSVRGQGGPGFLKARTVDKITDEILKFYDPFDVADAKWSSKVARDVANRKFFGKIEPDASGTFTEDSSFGRLISNAVKSGELQDRGLKILQENLRSLYVRDRHFNEAVEKIGTAARKFQTYAYLSDAGTALVQFADIFSIAREYGLTATIKGYSKGNFDLQKIGVTEGHNPDIADIARDGQGKIGKAIEAPFKWSMKKLIGTADAFQKSATVQATLAKTAAEINNPNSYFSKHIEKTYQEMFPDKWPAMKKSLQSKEFAQGKLDENSSLFLFSELSRLQPINASGKAQGYQQASAWGKSMYALRSYWLKQVDILRNQAYNNMKHGNFTDFRTGAREALTYMMVVAVGQQAFQVLKDKALGRDLKPEEYAMGGLLQLIGVPRYFIYRQKQIGLGPAALETLVPGAGVVTDLGKDLYLVNKARAGTKDAEGRKVVRDLGDFLKNAESTKYIPVVGREIYAKAGAGAEKEKKERQRVLNGGEARPTTIDELRNFFSPPDAKSR